MEPFPPRPLRRSGRSSWGIACLALLPLAAALLLLGQYPRSAVRPRSLPERGGSVPAEPFLPTGPTPQGDVSLKNLHFQPLEFRGFPAFFSSLTISSRDNRVTITAPGRDGGAIGVWSGPASAATFFQETAGGIHTLKDEAGNVLWSNATQLAQADLVVEKTDDGHARLTGKGGAALKVGRAAPTAQGGTPSQVRGGQTVLIVTPRVRVEGRGGFFHVTDGSLRWPGHLSPSRLIVVRDGRGFVVQGPGGSETGSDEASRVSMAAGAETVTVTDVRGRTLGTRTVDALAIRRTTGLSPLPQGFNQPVLYESQDGRLDKSGTLCLTYRDAAGRIVRRSKVYKDARGCGCSG